MEPTNSQASHTAQISSVHSALQALAGLLEQEHALLLRRDMESLPELVERKNRLLTQMQDMLVPGDPSAPGRQELSVLLHRVLELNQSNGELISARLEQTRQALEALRQR